MNLSALKSNHNQQVQTKITLPLELIPKQSQTQMVVLAATVINMYLLHNAAMDNMLHQVQTKQNQDRSFRLSEKIEKYMN